MSNNPLRGALYFFRGLPLIAEPGIRRYVLIPLAINVAGLAALLYWGLEALDRLIERLLGWLPGWLEWLSWVLWPLIAVAAAVVFLFGFSLLANLVAAPFNGPLAEAVERRLRDGAQSRGPAIGLVRDLVLSLAGECRKLAYFAVRALPLLLLFLIPGPNALAPLLWIAFGAWMLALEYGDFPMANHGLAFPEQRRTMRGRWLLGVGFGATVMAALAIPLLQFVVIPAAVAGATLMWVEELAPARE